MITSTTAPLSLKRIALIGNPNVGKSSLFNVLTGLRQKVGNYAGVTIEKYVGTWPWRKDEVLTVLDLPGLYSLFAKSADERVVLPPLLDAEHPERPDLLVVVLDASQLQRSLLLLDQVRCLALPIVVALNRIDVAETQGQSIDVAALEEALKLPLVPINARTGEGIGYLTAALEQATAATPPQAALQEDWAQALQHIVAVEHPFVAQLLLSQHSYLSHLNAEQHQHIEELLHQHQLDLLALQTADTKARLERLAPIAAATIKTPETPKPSLTDQLDAILLHPIGGYLVFFALLLLVFQAIFSFASVPMDWIDGVFAAGADGWRAILPESLLTDLLVDGIWAGIGGVVIFVPQIAILFTLIALLEETGYMARVMLLTDKTMSRFGLNGKSMVPLISGAACAVPAVMAARNIPSWRERLTTIFVTPLMSCSARLPVYIIFIAIAVPATTVWGIFSLQSLVLGGLYLGGFVAALLSAWLLNRLWKDKEPVKSGSFVLELPTYQLPQWRSIGITVYQKTKDFVVEAGKIILAISIVLWVLATYGPPKAMEAAEREAVELYTDNSTLAISQEALIASKQLEASYIGHLGHWIEPVIRPLGYDWKIGIALITSFAAREVFVSTMATIYSVGDADEDNAPLLEKLRNDQNAYTGQPTFTPAVSYSLLVFYLFAMQCMATLAIVKRETGSWKWALLQLVYMTGLAYVGAWLTYQWWS